MSILHITAATAAISSSLRVAKEREEEQQLIDLGICVSNAEARRLLHPTNREKLRQILIKRRARK